MTINLVNREKEIKRLEASISDLEELGRRKDKDLGTSNKLVNQLCEDVIAIKNQREGFRAAFHEQIDKYNRLYYDYEWYRTMVRISYPSVASDVEGKARVQLKAEWIPDLVGDDTIREADVTDI